MSGFAAVKCGNDDATRIKLVEELKSNFNALVEQLTNKEKILVVLGLAGDPHKEWVYTPRNAVEVSFLCKKQ